MDKNDSDGYNWDLTKNLSPPRMVTEEFKRTVLSYCSQFLSGTWTTIGFEDFTVTTLEGGLTNHLYICKINDNIEMGLPSEKRVVLLRIYGEIVDEITKFNEGIIFNIMSERHLGPKLLGAFPSGRLEEYIPSTHLDISDLHSGEYLESIAKLICNYHMINMPLNKNPNIFLSKIPKFLKFYENNIMNISNNKEYDTEVYKYIKTINNMDLALESRWLMEFLSKTHSPVVFCHNDLHEGNMMRTSNVDRFDSDVCLIDFEYSAYHYRGYDLGNLFCEYIYNCFDTKNDDGFSYDLASYPSKETQLKFASAYLDKCRELTAKRSAEFRSKYITTPEILVEESNRFSLASHMYWGLWSLVQFRVSKIKWNYLKYAFSRFEGYFHFKKRWGY